MQVSAAALPILKYHFKPEDIQFIEDERTLLGACSLGLTNPKIIVSTTLVLHSPPKNPSILLQVPKDNVRKWIRAGASEFKPPSTNKFIDRATVKNARRLQELFTNPSTILVVQSLARRQRKKVDDDFLDNFHRPERHFIKGSLGTMEVHRQLLAAPPKEFGGLVFGWLPKQKGFEWAVRELHEHLRTHPHPLSLKAVTILWHWGLLENQNIFEL